MLGISACATSPDAQRVAELEGAVSRAIDLTNQECSYADGYEQKTWRRYLGPAFCKEDRGPRDYQDILRIEPDGSLAFQKTSGSEFCSAVLKTARPIEFNSAVTSVMKREGFLETDAIYILSCRRGTCNGQPDCDGMPTRREFYRAAGNLLVTAYPGGRNYPNTATIFATRAAVDHGCADPQVVEKGWCYVPGERP